MEKYMWFYFGLMAILVIVNAIQIGRKVGRLVPNLFQIAVYLFAMVWFVTMITKGFVVSFFFWTGLAFVLCLCIEVWQISRIGNKEYKKIFLGIAFLLFAGIPVVLSYAILSNLI